MIESFWLLQNSSRPLSIHFVGHHFSPHFANNRMTYDYVCHIDCTFNLCPKEGSQFVLELNELRKFNTNPFRALSITECGATL